MDDYCDSKSDALALLREKQSRVLYVLLLIIAVMFIVDFTVGWIVDSAAVLGDSRDIFDHTLIYAISSVLGAAMLPGGFCESEDRVRR